MMILFNAVALVEMVLVPATVPFNVMVEVPALTVPLSDQLPPTVIADAPDTLKVPLFVKLPPMVNALASATFKVAPAKSNKLFTDASPEVLLITGANNGEETLPTMAEIA